MRKRKTDEIVFGAMMLAVYAILIIIDTYTGSLMNVFLYYIMPIPFVVFGLKYGLKMTACVGAGALILGMMFGLPETIFFSICAILIALVIIAGMSRKLDGGLMFLSIMLVTTVAQLLSFTVLAKLLGYDIAAEIKEIQSWLPVSVNMTEQLPVVLALMCFIIGGMEAFIITTFCDLVLIRLHLERLPKFSLVMLHFPKWVGYLFIVSMAIWLVWQNQITLFVFICFFLLLCVQGLSLGLVYIISCHRPRWLSVVMLFGCFIPGINAVFTLLGLYDIFSEIRQKLMYNKNKL